MQMVCVCVLKFSTCFTFLGILKNCFTYCVNFISVSTNCLTTRTFIKLFPIFRLDSFATYTFASKDENPHNQVDASFYQTFSFPSLQDSTGNVGNLEKTHDYNYRVMSRTSRQG